MRSRRSRWRCTSVRYRNSCRSPTDPRRPDTRGYWRCTPTCRSRASCRCNRLRGWCSCTGSRCCSHRRSSGCRRRTARHRPRPRCRCRMRSRTLPTSTPSSCRKTCRPSTCRRRCCKRGRASTSPSGTRGARSNPWPASRSCRRSRCRSRRRSPGSRRHRFRSVRPPRCRKPRPCTCRSCNRSERRTACRRASPSVSEQTCVPSLHVVGVSHGVCSAVQSRVESVETHENLQLLSQPSPFTRLPSSHSSGATVMPSPHDDRVQSPLLQTLPVPHGVPSVRFVPGTHV